MRIVRMHPGESSDYSCNVYWVISDSNLDGDRNTLVDVGSTRSANLDYFLREMGNHPKGLGRRAVDQVVLTHLHYDHIGGLQAIVNQWHPRIFAFQKEEGIDQTLADGNWLRLGDKDFKVLHTPGHSDDSICLFCPETGDLFSGDTLYRISDAKGSYPECFVRSLERLRDLNIKAIHPGHGDSIHAGIPALISATLQHVQASTLRMS